MKAALVFFLLATPAFAQNKQADTSVAIAQQQPSIDGDYSGFLGPLHFELPLTRSAEGVLSGSLDDPDEGILGRAYADFHLEGAALGFSGPSAHATWNGSVSSSGIFLKGTWRSQRMTLPLNFTHDAINPSPFDGTWLGTLRSRTVSLRIRLQVTSDRAGREFCTLDSLDQNSLGMECTEIVEKKNDFSFNVPAVHGQWNGRLSEDGKTLVGDWSQGLPVVLILKKQPRLL